MAIPYLIDDRKPLIYDKDKKPIENVQRFFDTVKCMRYRYVIRKIDGKSIYFLDSSWKNEIGLRDITNKFQKAFTEHLVQFSTDENQQEDYSAYLRNCKELLRTINGFYRSTFMDVLTITESIDPGQGEFIVNYDTLPDEYKVMIQRCYDLFIALFRHLEDCVNDEIKENERKEYVRDKSTFLWTRDKIEISEIALALFLSGGIKRRDGRKF